MPMLADLIDAVIGVDTHRDTHHAELALPTGAAIATCSISNDSAGYAQLLTWIADHAPGPRRGVHGHPHLGRERASFLLSRPGASVTRTPTATREELGDDHSLDRNE